MDQKYIDILKRGGVGVIPTDTIYGILGSAFSVSVVERIYTLKGRDENKPFIILISSLDELKKFSIILSKPQKKFLKEVWPGPVSVIFPVTDEKLSYLHRGKNSLAFRVPAKKDLIKVLAKTGPLVAPSANPQGMLPAKTDVEAKHYFADSIDFYENGGRLIGEPSAIIKVDQNGSVNVIRPNSVFSLTKNVNILDKFKITALIRSIRKSKRKNMEKEPFKKDQAPVCCKTKKIVLIILLIILVLLGCWFVFDKYFVGKQQVQTGENKLSREQVEKILVDLSQNKTGDELTATETKDILKEMDKSTATRLTPDKIREILK